MARYLYIKNNTVVNIVDSPYAMPDVSDMGEDIIPDPGGVNFGDTFNVATYRSTTARTPASNIIDDTGYLGKLFRAEGAVLVDEINALRQWITSFKAAVAAATTFANLQTRVAALASVPDRTLSQARTAIQTKITSGSVDS